MIAGYRKAAPDRGSGTQTCARPDETFVPLKRSLQYLD